MQALWNQKFAAGHASGKLLFRKLVHFGFADGNKIKGTVRQMVIFRNIPRVYTHENLSSWRNA